MQKNEVKKMKILIVEDEINYSDTLEMFVDELGYKTVGVAPEGKTAITLFDEKKPDLVLMDINLKGELTGIDLARIFQGQRAIPIIFITAFEDKETFTKAKKTGAYAYLIKPFDPNTLQRTIELALQNTYADGEPVFDSQREVVLATNCFFIKERSKLVKVEIDNILWIEVEDKYCIVHIESKKFAIRQSLKDLAKKLNPKKFVQTHRSFIVNAAKIQNIDLSLFTVTVHNSQIPLGKSHKEELLKRLQML